MRLVECPSSMSPGIAPDEIIGLPVEMASQRMKYGNPVLVCTCMNCMN
jgi:hypothetical protein